MVILPVPVPFQAFVRRLATSAFVQLLADPEPSPCRMNLPFIRVESADPTHPRAVLTMSTKCMMHLVYESQRKSTEIFITGPAEKFEKVAYSERIGPKVAPRRFPS
jgi:hypothetical protein